jgi:hypothetical protein|nr:MAG TPA: hypothetical protein [Caudoviricetes sp.]
MPNWCEGELKIRGKKNDIIRFMEEGIQPRTPLGMDLEKIKFIPGKCSTYAMSTCLKKYLIVEAGRAFIDEFMIEFENLESDETDIHVEAFPARFAWNISAEKLLDIAKKYNIDIKILGFECLTQFNQLVEIVDKKIIKNETITYEDYKWDCPFSKMGS